jgi:hypothetical protein
MLMAQILIFMAMWAIGLPMAPSNEQSFTMADYVEALKGKEWILALGFLLTVDREGRAVVRARRSSPSTTCRCRRRSAGASFAAISNLGAMIVLRLLARAGGAWSAS